MPTKYTPCEECNHLDWFDINHPSNYHLKQDIKKTNIIYESLRIPYDYCRFIIYHSNKLSCKMCTHCIKINRITLLCKKHTERGKKYHEHYYGDGDGEGIKCDQCCWLDI
jgi:hypothetical protein